MPYAFPFRTINDNNDFVLISVHLKPNGSRADKARRLEELTAISEWIDENDGPYEEKNVKNSSFHKNCPECGDSITAIWNTGLIWNLSLHDFFLY